MTRVESAPVSQTRREPARRRNLFLAHNLWRATRMAPLALVLTLSPLILMLGAGGPAAAQMAGGAGGAGFGGVSGGTSGTGGTTAQPNGGTGGNSSNVGGGGGGGGSVSLTTGAGGTGGAGGSGDGGAGGTLGTSGGVGSTTATNNTGSLTGGGGGNGGNGQPGAILGGGGGGGGGGGFGLWLTGSGSNSGSITGGLGGDGGSGDANGDTGGGGGGGGTGSGAVLLTGGGSYGNTGTLQGGTGGTGGGSDTSNGGGGGGGGVGAALTAGGSITNMSGGTITGGNGGNGGSLSDGEFGETGGNGGAGGAGLLLTGGGIVTNAGAITGGDGGDPGTSAGGNGAAGAGGVGITGANLTIINSGTIAGGLAGNGGTQNDAIVFTDGTNSVGSTGTISGGIDVQGGSFAPALSTSAIGTPLNFSGPLTFASGTQYVVRVSPSASDNATTSGAATLTGATVDAVFTSGNYVSKQYTILTATGGLGGTTFSGLTNTNLPTGASDSLSYNADDVFLDLTAPFSTFTGVNTNQQSVASALTNFFTTTGGIPAQFFGLTPGGLTQIDGEDATGAERGAFDLMNEFLDLMLDPFVDGRGGSSSGGALGFAPDQQENLPPDLALAYAGLLKAPPPQTFAQRWSTWAAGFGGSATTNGDLTVGSNNVTTSTYGYAAGLDYHYSPDTVFGFSLAGGGTNWNLAQGLGTGRSDAFLAGVYGVTHEGPWYLGGALAFANNWFTTNRTAMGDQLSASFQGQSYSARLESGYRFVVPTDRNAIGVTPYAAIQTQDFHTPAYSETDLTGGGFGLSYNAMNGTDTRSELGSRFDDLTTLDNLPLVLRAKLAWAHDWVSNPSLNASFESLPGTGFTVFGAPIPHDSALTSAGAQLFFTPNWSFLAKFDGEFAHGYQLYAGSGTLRYTW
jgi:uncharacterized protein with beta-barrel porin domain